MENCLSEFASSFLSQFSLSSEFVIVRSQFIQPLWLDHCDVTHIFLGRVDDLVENEPGRRDFCSQDGRRVNEQRVVVSYSSILSSVM